MIHLYTKQEFLSAKFDIYRMSEKIKQGSTTKIPGQHWKYQNT